MERIESNDRGRDVAPIVWCLLNALCAAVAGVLISGCASSLDHRTQIPGRGMVGAVSGNRNDAGLAPGSLPAPAEELWVIARTRSISQPAEPGTPTSGAMCVPVEDALVPMPLKHTDVKAEIAGYIASVKVLQQFHNPYDRKIEAVYVFPLPENAAVNEFVMTIGERRIRGIIRERDEAEKIYRDAKRQGYVASLLTQERPNLFTQSVANIEPGRAIDVTLQYFHTLAYDAGWYEFVFPMVVGPRFNPAGIMDGVGAVARTRRGESGQTTDVSYLAPDERSGHDIALTVDVQAGVPIEETTCASHRTAVARPSAERVTVTLHRDDRIPNKDFVLRYRVAGRRIKSNLLTHEDARGGFFTLMLYPPGELEALARQPLELVFVLDTSGSMSGGPLEQARAAIGRALDRLQPGDSFQIINFAMRASALGPKPVEATPENVRRGRQYLRDLDSDGGTMMIEGIKAALEFPHDPERLRFVCFLTDGYIGNEAEILAAIQGRIGASRIFSFGVGSSPNRYLMDSMARAGRGAVAYLGMKDDATTVMDTFFDRISHPALTDVEIDWGGMKVRDVFPRRAPDLFVGRPLIVTGRYDGKPGTIRIRGRAAGRVVVLPVNDTETETPSSHPALASVWARLKIAELAAQAWTGDARELADAIRKVALDFNLMSAFTAFVAVDATRQTAGEPAVTAPVAVPVPAGVNYDRTVQPRE